MASLRAWQWKRCGWEDRLDVAERGPLWCCCPSKRDGNSRRPDRSRSRQHVFIDDTDRQVHICIKHCLSSWWVCHSETTPRSRAGCLESDRSTTLPAFKAFLPQDWSRRVIGLTTGYETLLQDTISALNGGDWEAGKPMCRWAVDEGCSWECDWRAARNPRWETEALALCAVRGRSQLGNNKNPATLVHRNGNRAWVSMEHGWQRVPTRRIPPMANFLPFTLVGVRVERFFFAVRWVSANGAPSRCQDFKELRASSLQHQIPQVRLNRSKEASQGPQTKASRYILWVTGRWLCAERNKHCVARAPTGHSSSCWRGTTRAWAEPYPTARDRRCTALSQSLRGRVQSTQTPCPAASGMEAPPVGKRIKCMQSLETHRSGIMLNR